MVLKIKIYQHFKEETTLIVRGIYPSGACICEKKGNQTKILPMSSDISLVPPKKTVRKSLDRKKNYDPK